MLDHSKILQHSISCTQWPWGLLASIHLALLLHIFFFMCSYFHFQNRPSLFLLFSFLASVELLHKTAELPWGSVLGLMILAAYLPGSVYPKRDLDLQQDWLSHACIGWVLQWGSTEHNLQEERMVKVYFLWSREIHRKCILKRVSWSQRAISGQMFQIVLDSICSLGSWHKIIMFLPYLAFYLANISSNCWTRPSKVLCTQMIKNTTCYCRHS